MRLDWRTGHVPMATGANPPARPVSSFICPASRQHAALVYHGRLGRPYLMDLGSAHGTFWAATRLAPHAPTPLPQPLPADDVFRFGASTRGYKLRDAPPDGSDVRDMTEYNKMVLARESRKRRLDANDAGDADATKLDGRACKKARRLTVRFNDHVYEHLPTRTSAGPRFADVVQSVVIARKVRPSHNHDAHCCP
jgi:nuclear inhibitor of protein phosphatase 1